MIAAAVAAAALACPHRAALGRLAYRRGTTSYVLSFADCVSRRAARTPRSQAPAATVRAVRAAGSETGTEEIVLRGRVVYRLGERYRTWPAGSPGPIVIEGVSPDGRWVFFAVDPLGSASLAADGLPLEAVDARSGRVVHLPRMLLDEDYRTWCGDALVLVAGGNRIATTSKRLLVARPPDWRPRPLWRDPRRAFGSVACAPDGRSVAVLSQRASSDAAFFSTRWQLWQVALDGSRALLDAPPPGRADESPLWSPHGDALLFVRERRGTGRAMLLRQGILFGPVANLGYSLGYYGHHDWWLGATWHE